MDRRRIGRASPRTDGARGLAAYDFTTKRLFVEHSLAPDGAIDAGRPLVNRLLNVLRMREGDAVLLFNGRDGEWRARLEDVGRRSCTLRIEDRTREQTEPGDLWLCFAPLKHARLDYMVQKTVEMGASRLLPTLTQRTQATRVNLERMRANAIEAAEQCGVLSLPGIDEPTRLDTLLAGWDQERRLIFCDEGAAPGDPLGALRGLEPGPLGLLIGPEGGFSETEREGLRARDLVTAIPLGPRILRADTAAVAALAVVQAALGDWRA